MASRETYQNIIPEVTRKPLRVIVVDLDLFVSGSVFRGGTKYPPKSMCGLGDVSQNLTTSQTRCVNHPPCIFHICTCLASGS